MTDFSQIEEYVRKNKEEVVKILSDFVLHDTLLFWAKENELALREKSLWSDVLNEFYHITKINYKTTNSLKEPEENEKNKGLFCHFLKTLPIKKLTAVYLAATNVRSVITAVCLAEGCLSASEAFQCAYLEEIFQTEKWGMTDEISAQHEKIKKSLYEAEQYVRNGNVS